MVVEEKVAMEKQEVKDILEALMKPQKKSISIRTPLESLEFYDEDLLSAEEEYFFDTFLDPIDIWEFKENSKEARSKMAFRQFVTYFIETPISRVPRNYVEEHIKEIHIESEDFNPTVLVNEFHKDMNPENRNSIGKVIPLHFGKDSKKNLALYNFSFLVDLEDSIGGIKECFDQN